MFDEIDASIKELSWLEFQLVYTFTIISEGKYNDNHLKKDYIAV